MNIREWRKSMGIFFACILCFAFGLTPVKAQRWEFSHQQMGTVFRIITYTDQPVKAQTAADAAFKKLDELNESLSDYLPDSELNRLCQFAGKDTFIEVSTDLWEVLVAAKYFSELSEGYFDVTIGPLTRLWRRSRRKKSLPDLETLSKARDKVGYEYILMDSLQQKIKLEKTGMRLDLGGIAKGYAIEKMLELLYQSGLKRSLIDGGGDIVVGLPPPDSAGWRISIPFSFSNPQAGYHTLYLKEQAIATSGDAYRFLEIDGVKYSHLLDPHTGIGLSKRISVTSISKSATTADALASMISVLGWEASIAKLLEWDSVEFFIQEAQNQQINNTYTSNFQRYFFKP